MNTDSKKTETKQCTIPIVSCSAYTFNPLNHGFEPISNFPEMKFNFPLIDGYYIKVVCYSNHGGLVYWYKVISTLIGFEGDDRIEVKSGLYDFRKPSEYGKQSNPKTEYLGLVSSDEFAEQLLKHLLGTTDNKSLNDCAIERYNENQNIIMKTEFPQHYS